MGILTVLYSYIILENLTLEKRESDTSYKF